MTPEEVLALASKAKTPQQAMDLFHAVLDDAFDRSDWPVVLELLDGLGRINNAFGLLDKMPPEARSMFAYHFNLLVRFVRNQIN